MLIHVTSKCKLCVTNTAIAPLISLAFVLGLLAVTLGVANPLLGESLAVVAAQVNDLTIGIVRNLGEWQSMPWPFTWNASTAPTPVLYGIAIGVLLCASTEFRRAVCDLYARVTLVDEATALLVLGSGFGAFAGVLVFNLVR